MRGVHVPICDIFFLLCFFLNMKNTTSKNNLGIDGLFAYRIHTITDKAKQDLEEVIGNTAYWFISITVLLL